MAHQSEAMKAMAQRYLRLARTTKNARERTKFFDYAMLYAQLSEQSERRQRNAAARAAPPSDGEMEQRNGSRRHYH